MGEEIELPLVEVREVHEPCAARVAKRAIEVLVRVGGGSVE